MTAAGRIFTLFFAATALSAGSVQAAVLTSAGKPTYVDSGQGFKPVPTRTTVNPGNVISVPPGGRATLVYPNGCAFTINPKRPVTVAHEPPTCHGGPKPHSGYDHIIGKTVMTGVFGTIIYKAIQASP